MKIIVFGATGSIGQHVIEQSLKKGYETTAFCRAPRKLKSHSPTLKKVTGDIYDLETLTQAIKGQDVVINVLGSGKNRYSKVRSEGTQNIIQAMQKTGVKRLICQTTLGAGDSHTNLNFFWKNIMFGWFLKQVFLDHELQEDYVKNSGLDWTIVRPGAFTNDEITKKYKHGFSAKEPALKLKISRPDVADFILNQITNKDYLFKTPGLSY